MKKVHLIISGDVHGVGFRLFIKRQAENLGVTGWVRNRRDGAVEAVAEGDTQTLETLIKLCRQGPEVAGVEDVQDEWSEATGEFPDFIIEDTG